MNSQIVNRIEKVGEEMKHCELVWLNLAIYTHNGHCTLITHIFLFLNFTKEPAEMSNIHEPITGIILE